MVRNGADRPAISTGPALMIPAGYPRDLPSALLRAARDFGTSGVVEIGPDGRETRLDFPTLLELAARILAGLRANGVRAGDPAVVHCTEPVGFFAAFWACTLGGIRPLLMAPSAEGDRTEEGRERLRKVTDLLGWAVLIGRPSDLPDDLGLPVLDPDALAGHEPTAEFHRPAADDVAVLMLSSGTSTGTPKIIQLTHRGLVEFAAGTPAMLPVRPGQTTLNWLPLDHSGAFLLYHLLPVFAGCTNIHVATDWVLANPLRWLDLMDAHRVNHSWSPNFGYRLATAAIAGEPDRHWDLSALRSLVSGGEQITVPVVSEFLRLTNRFGVVPETFVAAWGMTETVTGITFARPGLAPNVHRVRIPPTGVVEWVDQRTTAGKVAVARPGKSRVEAPGLLSLVSVGTPAPGATVRIVGPNGAVLPEGRIGQLQIASARVTPGYLGNPDADRAAFPAGNWPARKWLATGDQAFITGGQVVITGRDSERIILNGQNYYAHDIETVAASVPGAELGLVAACGIADASVGTERLMIFFAVNEPTEPVPAGTASPAAGVADAIRAVLNDRLGLRAQVIGVPRRHFPTTPGGKILRPLLKQRFVDGSLNAPPSPYGEPLRANTPYDAPSARAGIDDDSDRTTELPVVRLAWRRTLADSIPTPPERPTLGANRVTPPATGHLAESAAAAAESAPTAGPAENPADVAEETTDAELDGPAADDVSPAEALSEAAEVELTHPAAAEPADALPERADADPQPAETIASEQQPVEDIAPETPEEAGQQTGEGEPAADEPSEAAEQEPASTDQAAAVEESTADVVDESNEPVEQESASTDQAAAVEESSADAAELAEEALEQTEGDPGQVKEPLAPSEVPAPVVEAIAPETPEEAGQETGEGEPAADEPSEAAEQETASTDQAAAVKESTAGVVDESNEAAEQESASTDQAAAVEESTADVADESSEPVESAPSDRAVAVEESPADVAGSADEARERAEGDARQVKEPLALSEVPEPVVEAIAPETPEEAGQQTGEGVPAADEPSEAAEQESASTDRAVVFEESTADVVDELSEAAEQESASSDRAAAVEESSADAAELAEEALEQTEGDPGQVKEPLAPSGVPAPVVEAIAPETPEEAGEQAGELEPVAGEPDEATEEESDATGRAADVEESTEQSTGQSEVVEQTVVAIAPETPEEVGEQASETEPAADETSEVAEEEPASTDQAAAVEESVEDLPEEPLAEAGKPSETDAAKLESADAAKLESADAAESAESTESAEGDEAAESPKVAVPANGVAQQSSDEVQSVEAPAADEATPKTVTSEEPRVRTQGSSDASRYARTVEVAATGEPAGAGEWLGLVVGAFRGVLGDEVDERTGLYEAGIDSVAMVRVHTRLQEVLGLEFPRSVMFEHESILALSNFLEERADEFRSTAAAHSSEQAAPARTQAKPARNQGKPARKQGKAAKKQAVEPIAIIGLAARFPGADTLEQFWDNLAGGVESLRRFTPDEVAGAKDALGNEELVAVSGALDDVESFDAEFFGLSDREAELTDPAQRIFLEVCQHALEHGGHAGAAGRIGIFAGSGMNLYASQNQPPDSLATRVAYRLGLTGPAIGVQAAWSSSLVAIHLACQALRSGDADLALAGAAAVHVPQATGYRASPESILSPTGHLRVFDAAADGTVGGNGVAAVLLKRLDQAVTDGDTVYAVIRGSAVSNESDQADLVDRALEKAGVPAESISYIEANATGTATEDAREFRALASVLRKHTDKVGFCTIGSVKPNIGHLDSAAGMAGLIKTVLMLQHRTLVPTINQTLVDPDLPIANSPFVIGTKVRDWEAGTPLRAGVSALDAGGTSAHVILEEAPRQVRRGDDGPVVLPLSAPDPEALTELVELFRVDLEAGTGHRLIDLASTAALGRPAHRQRLAVAGSSEAELAEALSTAQAAAVPRGGPGPLGFAFTGQGAARRGMAAGLAARFPAFRSVLDECDKVYAEEFGGSLLELLLAPGSTSEGVWPTETAQPALFAFEVALARLWESFGVQPALVVGHSVGEYAALCVAGALPLADGVRLTAKRGELMQRGTAPGAMVAVRADADRVRELAQTPGVEIAAGNGPQSFVLTGSEVIVGQLAEQLDRLEVSWQRLDVDRAFHSSLVDPILADFAEVVAQISLRPLRMPMVSSWSGELLESGTALDSDYLVGQLRQPVLFGDAVEALTAAGCRRFLELGPDAVLSPAGRRIAPNSTWIPAQRLGQDPVLATMNGLAELYEQGTEIAWSKVYPNAGRVPLPLYPFRRVHHPVDTTTTTPAAPAEPAAVPSTEAGTTALPVMRADGGEARLRPALKRIPLDPPASNGITHQPTEAPEDAESSPFALPEENTHPVEPTVTEIEAATLPAAPVEDSTASESGWVSEDQAVDPATDDSDESADESVGVADSGTAAERYRDSLGVVLDLTGEQLGLDPYDVTVDHTFAELGADSLSMLRVVEELGQRFDVQLAVSELFEELDTPHKLASAVASRNHPDGEVDPLDLLRSSPADSPDHAETPDSVVVKDSRTALAVLGSGLAELAAKVDAAAAATSEADLPGSGMAALMSQQLRVAGQLVDGVTKLMLEQLALLNEVTQTKPTENPTTASESATAEAAGEMAEAEAARVAAKAKQAVDLEFWHGVLAGAQPLLLPSDQPRPAASVAVASVELDLDASLGDAIFAFSRDRKVSPLMTMLAAVGTVLGRFAAQDDITIGTAALRGAGAQDSRALPLRMDLSGEPDLGDLAQRVREITIAAFDHAAADLAVLEQDPLFQVLVEFEPGDESLAPDLDLRLRLAHHPGGIRCTADYRAGLFDQATIERLLHYLEAVLRRAITEPRLSLPELMLPIEADRKLLAEFEGEPPPAGPIGRVRRNAVVAGELSGLHTLFEQQVARTPDAVAVVQGDREFTYAELNRRSNAVAWQLVDLGIKPGQLVAVRVARGTELVVAVLAVLKSGAAYLPLDPGVPESRWAFMINDSGAVALVGDDAALADRLGLRLVPVAAVDGDLRAKQAPPVRAAADDVAYCIYTSDSSGNPKGVAVPHRGPVNLIRQYLRTRRSLRTLQWTSFGFDVHVQELFTALASGAALVVIGEDDRYDPDEVVAALTKYEVERLFMTFTPLTALLATMPEMPRLPALREIVAGGEAMVLTQGIKEFLAAHPECLLFNEYGPTEASVVTTIHQVDPAEDRPSIGRPIDGVVVRLLDEVLRAVPVGAIGEIHLGGAAVAQGYLGRPDETEAAFVNDPAHPGGRLYRSRDLGRWRADGTLDYLGRVDDQVKIRGHRVEPGETEYVLADLPGVVDAVVVANTDPAGDTCLIGYVVLEDSNPAVLARLLLELTKELPIYLVPADLIPIEDLPLDASGKLDRARLPEPEWLKA